MPLTTLDGTLFGAGVGFVALSTYYFRKRQTVPFKAAYFAAWPVLGTAIILIATPSREQMVKSLKANGIETSESLDDAHKRSEMQMKALRETAGRH